MTLYKRGSSWYCEFTYRKTRYGPRSLGPISYETAKRLEARWRLEVAEGLVAPPTHPPVPLFSIFAEEFLAWHGASHRPASFVRYRQACRVFLRLCGDRPLDEVTLLALERYKRLRVAEGIKPRTINTDLQVLHQMLKTARKWGVLWLDPAEGIRAIRTDEVVVRVLSEEEEARLLRACSPKLRPLVIVGLQTGLRRGELESLTWAQIDWGRQEVIITRAKSRRVRRVPLSHTAFSVVQGLYHGQLDGLVFGVPSMVYGFRTAVERAGLLGISPHSLRHTFATRCLDRGINIRRVQRWLGHHSVRVTERYVHPDPARDHEAIQALDRLDISVIFSNREGESEAEPRTS